MDTTIRHLKVPVQETERDACLGPDGSVALVDRAFRILGGRWKLQILFRLYAEPTMRSSQFLRDISGISQKVLTQNLRDLEANGLIQRTDFDEQPPRVEYAATDAGLRLMPALLAIREFARELPLPEGGRK